MSISLTLHCVHVLLLVEAAVFICRYVDKDALHDIHERSTPYLRLKDDVKSEGIEYQSVISQSYYEQDLGFMETKF